MAKTKSPTKDHPTAVQKWRQCPLGQHYRRSLYQHPYTRNDKPVRGSHHRATCVRNTSGKDEIYSDELEIIARKYFSDLSGPPFKDDFEFKSKGNKYDAFIRGWTQYWNDVLKPTIPLDPSLVKALIASESSFKSTSENKVGPGNKARGLLQITDESLKILRDENGELRDHLVTVYQNEMSNPNLNIAAGIRWLFRKKEIADSRLGENSTWRDAVAFYKSVKSSDNLMKKFDHYYGKLRKEGR